MAADGDEVEVEAQTQVDEVEVEGGAGDDVIVTVQHGDEMVDYKDGEEVARRPLVDADELAQAVAEAQGATIDDAPSDDTPSE